VKYIASCSFGKDSLAVIIIRMEHGEPVDGAVYCRIMFDGETSAELPEHEGWIHAHAIPLLKSRYGIETTVVQPKSTYCGEFHRVYATGDKVGRIYGFPFLRGPWCNSHLKVRPMIAWGKAQGEYRQIVGIAADEHTRAEKDTVRGLRMNEMWLACDTDGSLQYFKKACSMLTKAGFNREKIKCYVLIGDDMDKNEARLQEVYRAGAMPFAQLYQPFEDEKRKYSDDWERFRRMWSRPAATRAHVEKGTRYKDFNT
jgi:hypothetical protein